MPRSASNVAKLRLSFASLNYPMRRFYFHATLLAGVLFLVVNLSTAQIAPEPAPAQTASAESSSKQNLQKKTSHTDDFLVRGTVFTPEGLACPGAELRIRRTSEKKFKWSDVSNSRGNFAIRVKMGGDYEVFVHAKGFQDQSQTVDAKTGERFKDLVFHMQVPERKS